MKELVTNVKVYGLEESAVASGYPMKTKITSIIPTDKDYERSSKLAQTGLGEGHSTFLQGIIVQFDLNFTVKAWTEAERYHFLDFVSSQSTMHRITKFDLDDSYIEYVDPRIINIMKEKVEDFNNTTDKEDEKRKYLEILYSNPCGFQLTARMTTNYQQLRTIYNQRRNHRLPEWVEFCKWIKTLPHSDWITSVTDKITSVTDNK